MTHYPDIQLYIDGRWTDGVPGVPVINPADERELGLVPKITMPQLEETVSAAQRGLAVWRDTAPAVRARTLTRAAALLRERQEVIAHAITLEQGRPLAFTRLEVERACSILEWDAAEAQRLYGQVIPGDCGKLQYTHAEPVGVVAGFSPWNFPLGSPARKVAGALAAGCSLILKASEETPAGACFLVQALHDAGLPPGVLNLVFGNPAEISDYLIPHPAIAMVTLTGSVPVGKLLAEMAGRHMKPALMELGGHAPVIVCDDVDPVAAGRTSARAKAGNAGQVCVSPTRFFVQESVYDDFVSSFAEEAAAVKVGNGLDEGVQMGPLTNGKRLEAMERLVADATSKGARLAAGGKRIGNNGYFYPLTVLADVPASAHAMQEEPFGPLALISPVGDLDDAVRQANSVPFGLAAYAFTDSSSRALKLARSLACGNLAINHFSASSAETPFGGVKDSGYGREGGSEGVRAYTSIKLVSQLMG